MSDEGEQLSCRAGKDGCMAGLYTCNPYMCIITVCARVDIRHASQSPFDRGRGIGAARREPPQHMWVSVAAARPCTPSVA